MEEVGEVKKKSKEKESRFGKRYGFELKLRCVKLRLEEGLPVSLLSKEVGVSKDVVYRWVKAYQEQGEAGLRNRVRSSERRRKLPGPVRKKIRLYYYDGFFKRRIWNFRRKSLILRQLGHLYTERLAAFGCRASRTFSSVPSFASQ